MKRPSRLPLLFLAALVMALSYVGGALAPPLHGASRAGLAAPEVTYPQWEAVRAATDLLMGGGELDYFGYLPLLIR